MANTNEPRKSKKNLDPATAQKLREQLADKVSQLTDDELTSVAGGLAVTPTLTVPNAVPNPMNTDTGPIINLTI